MKEMLIEGEGLNQQGGRGQDSSAVVIPLGDVSGWNEASETIDR